MSNTNHKGNPYATNKGGVIRAPKPVKDQPKADVVKGSDLRDGKKKVKNINNTEDS